MARNYIVEIADITNCNDTVVANTSVNLRNGPGTIGTTIITTLIKGQVLTRIETGKYNLDGYVWDRVKLSDGRQGYIAQNYISKTSENTETKNEIVKVICKSGLKIREQPGTDQRVLTYVAKGTLLTRTVAGASNANGIVWDKIITSTGMEGYIARGDSTEQYIEIVNSSDNNGGNNNTNDEVKKNDNFKMETDNLICEPQTSVEAIKEKYTNKTITVKDAKGNLVTTGNIGTGYTVKIDSKSYTIVKLGDVNGDGNVNSGDLFYTQKYLLKQIKFNEYTKEACDVNKDNEINSGDLFYIQKYLLKKTEFSI